MDPSAAPWRILEEPAGAADPVPATADREPGGRAGHPSFPRSSLLIGGSAAGLAIIAFVLAFGSGSAGSVA
ncbi:MAG TPA: hypothetical protein VIM25_06450, partial [Candidatus Limnocylindrales bacterium]